MIVVSTLTPSIGMEPEVPTHEVSLSDLSRFIELGTSYLVRVSHTHEQDPKNEGKFTYIAYLDEDLPLDFTSRKQVEYNLFRHNGAIYSLSLFYSRQKHPSVLKAKKRAFGNPQNEPKGPIQAV